MKEIIKEKAIVIGGGVGPMAGVELHKRIIENTLTDGTDQDHFEVLHFSRSHDIPDRTEFLLGKENRDPAMGMLRTFKMAEVAIQERPGPEKPAEGKEKYNSSPAVGGIPCNTFHAPEIFDRFVKMIEESEIHIEVVNMIEETITMIEETTKDVSRIGLLSTTGTRKFGIYSRLLEQHGFSVVEVPEKYQNKLHNAIYNREWGIKAVSPVTEKAQGNFERFAEMLVERNAQCIILGCTEIPIALPMKYFKGIPLIDPMVALARGLIARANPAKLKPLFK